MDFRGKKLFFLNTVGSVDVGQIVPGHKLKPETAAGLVEAGLLEPVDIPAAKKKAPAKKAPAKK